LAAAAAGFLDASYLTVKHYLGGPVVCVILQGCDVVTTSKYSVVGPAPVALFGAIYYFFIFFLAALYIETKRELFLAAAAALTPVGFLASLWFVYLQFFIIKAICLYCMISAGSSTLLFALGLFVLKLRRGSII
jgi:uncharacterized membrane protein